MGLQLTATEVRNSSHTDTATVTITLLDVNDEAPVFSQSRYSKDVEEGTSLNATVLKVEADDNDVSPEFGKASIRYGPPLPHDLFFLFRYFIGDIPKERIYFSISRFIKCVFPSLFISLVSISDSSSDTASSRPAMNLMLTP